MRRVCQAAVGLCQQHHQCGTSSDTSRGVPELSNVTGGQVWMNNKQTIPGCPHPDTSCRTLLGCPKRKQKNPVCCNGLHKACWQV